MEVQQCHHCGETKPSFKMAKYTYKWRELELKLYFCKAHEGQQSLSEFLLAARNRLRAMSGELS